MKTQIHIARWPSHIPADETRSALGCITGLMATATAVTGDSLASEVVVDSHNLLPVILGERQESPWEVAVHHSLDGMFSVR